MPSERDQGAAPPPAATPPGGAPLPPDATSPGSASSLADTARPGGAPPLPDATSPGGAPPAPAATSPGGAGPAAVPLSTHLNEAGEVRMVDVGAKPATLRRARAEAEVRLAAATLERLRRGDTPKGDVLATVRLAGIQAAKRTDELIPLCHGLALTKVEVGIELGEATVTITATAEAFDRTGVEMEAMVAASVAALTLYDMLKGVDRAMSYSVRLLEKSGGRSGTWRPAEPP